MNRHYDTSRRLPGRAFDPETLQRLDLCLDCFRTIKEHMEALSFSGAVVVVADRLTSGVETGRVFTCGGCGLDFDAIHRVATKAHPLAIRFAWRLK